MTETVPSQDWDDLEQELAALLRTRANGLRISQPKLAPGSRAGKHRVVPAEHASSGGRRAFWLVAAALIGVLGFGIYAQSGGEPNSVASAPIASEADESVEYIVWVESAASVDQIATITAAIEASSAIDSFIYVDREATYAEFVDFWSDSPEVLNAVTADQLPTSFRVQVNDVEAVVALASLDGVQDIQRPEVQYDELVFVTDEPTLLVFAADWCPHCSRVLPGVMADLAALENVRIVGISVLAPPDVTTTDDIWVALAWPYEIAWLNNGDESPLGIEAFPSVALWSPDGVVGEPLVGDDITADNIADLLDE